MFGQDFVLIAVLHNVKLMTNMFQTTTPTMAPFNHHQIPRLPPRHRRQPMAIPEMSLTTIACSRPMEPTSVARRALPSTAPTFRESQV